jgi:hypothetical protein
MRPVLSAQVTACTCARASIWAASHILSARVLCCMKRAQAVGDKSLVPGGLRRGLRSWCSAEKRPAAESAAGANGPAGGLQKTDRLTAFSGTEKTTDGTGRRVVSPRLSLGVGGSVTM